MKEAYYFSHDSNAKDDPKCVMLIDQMGLEGYGIFWVLVEVLRDQPEYKYPLALIPALARRYNTTAEKMKTVIKSYNLFQTEDEQFFYSQSLCQRMALKEKISEIQRQKAIKRWGSDATALPEQCHGNTTAMPIKESKGKESKGKENKVLKESTEKNFEVIETPPLPIKNKFGAYSHVLMTSEEFHDLVKAAGKDTALEYIQKLDEYIETTGKQYQNHALVVRKWINKDLEEKYKTKPDSLTADDRVNAVLNSLSNKPKSAFDQMMEDKK